MRWILFPIGILAMVALTAITVFSLITLRKRTVTSQEKTNKHQISQFAKRISTRLHEPYHLLYSVNMANIKSAFQTSREFPQRATNVLMQIATDSIYHTIYYLPAESEACFTNDPIFRFNPQTKRFESTSDYPFLVCKGVNFARARALSFIKNYRFNYY